MKTTKFSPSDVINIAKLANLPVTQDQAHVFAPQLSSILDYFQMLGKLPTKGVTPTAQVTGLTSVLRDDAVDPTRILTNEEALSNAKRSHNGYFVVDRVLE